MKPSNLRNIQSTPSNKITVGKMDDRRIVSSMVEEVLMITPSTERSKTTMEIKFHSVENSWKHKLKFQTLKPNEVSYLQFFLWFIFQSIFRYAFKSSIHIEPFFCRSLEVWNIPFRSTPCFCFLLRYLTIGMH